MALGSRAFWLPRRGNNPEEYEDAFAAGGSGRVLRPGRRGLGGVLHGVVGPAVGRRLCFSRGAGRQPLAVLAARRPGAMGPRRSRPEAGLGRRLLGRAGCVSPPSWDSCWKTPLSLWERGREVRARSHWQAVAVGDTCLFHTRNGALLRAFPLGPLRCRSATGRSLSARACRPLPQSSDSACGATAAGSRATGFGP